ncbi:hypothetical protein DFH07DRAFT_303752 [Mycena maculata]|uniref:Uncharacterized protein n=1 Tax=Mycena maculata TaxID=230809 RepID=A0AAD7HHX1_9AGAR|nr:hypothetical protein DFH07DRAFT_303752 [Mycena maculata]
MPATNYTIDDVDPLIQYTAPGAWSAGNGSDPLASQYSNNGTFTVCDAEGSAASFSFNGTHVWVYGALRPDHGPYSVNLDGNIADYDGFSKKANFTYLFDSGTLNAGPHTVVVTNTGNSTNVTNLDIDYIIWSTDSSAVAQNITLKDNTAQFSYQPSSSWTTALPKEISGFQGNSGHFTMDNSASTILSFSGDTVSVFGAVGPSLGPYGITLDGESVGTFNATKQNYTAQMLLYHADGLGAGDHTLEVINQPTDTGQGLAIDFARVAGIPGASVAATSASMSASASVAPLLAASSNMPELHTGVIVCAVVGSLCLAATIGGLLFRQIHIREKRRDVMQGTTDVAAFIMSDSVVDGSRSSVNASNANTGVEAAESETTHLLQPPSESDGLVDENDDSADAANANPNLETADSDSEAEAEHLLTMPQQSTGS